MEVVVAALAALVAVVYLLLGPLVIPALLKPGQETVAKVARGSLRIFFVACAGTHLFIAGVIAWGIPQPHLAHHLWVHVPQVLGGYLFLLLATRFK